MLKYLLTFGYMKPRALFYVLVVYVLLQFCWWAYLLTDLNTELYTARIENLKLRQGGDAVEAAETLYHHLRQKWLMVLGEGSVFFFLLVLGILRLRKVISAEMTLARQQKNFVLSVTHELKSPLASIKLYLQTLQKRDLDRTQQQVFISHALNDTDRLNNLVENVLFAAHIESNAYRFQKEKQNLSAIVNEAAQAFLFAEEKHIRSEILVEKGIEYAVDVLPFVSVVTNLLENAVKYSPSESKITVILKKENNKILLRVTDEGCGIPDSEKENIFRKFYRIGREETRTTKGTGLGLYLVKYIVEQHGGKIQVKDNSPKGAIFDVSLPL